MSKTSVSPNQSFFDSPETEVSTFWKQMNASDFSNYPLDIEGNFYIRSKKLFQEQSSCILAIRSTFLIFKKKKHDISVEYLDFEEFMFKLEIIGPTDKRYSTKYKYAFSLSAQGKSADFYCKEKAQFHLWLHHFKKFCLMTNFKDVYQMLDIIGTGGYGKVYMLQDIETKTKWAGKFIKLSPVKSLKRQQIMVMNEIKILRKVNHPTIVKLREVYEVDGEICMVMEYVKGEKLFNHVINNKRLSEPETAIIIKQLLLALYHFQSKDIIHRDIKPENVLLVRDGEQSIQVKVIDFGLGTFHTQRDIIKKCGTAGYVAPEILNSDPYDFSADLYSAGIVMLVCLTGKPAFQAKDYHELLEKNRNNVVRTKGKKWSKLSPEARQMIQNLTDTDPALRMTLVEALNHEWFIQNLTSAERKDIPELTFQFIKMSVPEEGKISQMPTPSGLSPVLNKLNSNSFNDYGSGNSNFSQSFVTSQTFFGQKSCTLNSFYKTLTRESSISTEQPSIATLGTFGTSKSIQKKRSEKDNVLVLPMQRSPSGHRRSISLQSVGNKDLKSFRSAITYKIQVSTIEPSSHGNSIDEDEDKPCGAKYMELSKNDFVVKKLT